jgi:hypothetical protein
MEHGFKIRKNLTPMDIYYIQYRKAWYYYATDDRLTDDQVDRASNIFAVKNTWIEYNKYMFDLKLQTFHENNK